MPLNDERPACSSSSEDHGSDGDSSSDCCESVTSGSALSCSRDSFSSSKHCTPSSSPPKTFPLDEVMDVRDLFHLKVLHEIVVNKDFHFDLNKKTPNSLWNAVKDKMHKAFWDILEAELHKDPPEYQHAIKFLEEIREILLSFLNPGANRMRTQIMEVLDIELIRQQADNDAVDIQAIASFVISTMGKLCAPVRDEDIRKLKQSTDNIPTLLKEIFRVLDLMMADTVNYTVDSLRPLISSSVEYERATFQSILDKSPNGLNRTKSWIRSALEELEKSADPGKGEQAMPGPVQILNTAFLQILLWDFSNNVVPETLMTDDARLEEIQRELKICQAVNEVLLILHSTVGGAVQGVSSLSDRLKRLISVLLEGMHNPGFKLEETLEGVSAQVCRELNKSLTERGFPALTLELQATLRGQIRSISHKDNPIRTLVEYRVLQYFTALLSHPKPDVILEQVPAGLTAIKPELSLIGKKFLSVVKYNKAVYGPFYVDIIRKLLFGDSPALEPADSASHG